MFAQSWLEAQNKLKGTLGNRPPDSRSDSNVHSRVTVITANVEESLGTATQPVPIFTPSSPFLNFFFLGPYLWHMEVPRLGVESELQVLAYATTTATGSKPHL